VEVRAKWAIPKFPVNSCFTGRQSIQQLPMQAPRGQKAVHKCDEAAVVGGGPQTYSYKLDQCVLSQRASHANQGQAAPFCATLSTDVCEHPLVYLEGE